MPRHADEQRSVIAEVGGPPVLRIGQQSLDVGRKSFHIKAFQRLVVVEIATEGISDIGIVRQQLQVEQARPPVAVAAALGGRCDGVVGHRASAGRCRAALRRLGVSVVSLMLRLMILSVIDRENR